MPRFGVFEFDAEKLELVRNGRPVRLQPQPAQVLRVLVEHAGQTVTREELRQAVWHDDTFVDFDRGLNFCIAQIRTALGDDAAAPRYIRTVPKRGYEFVCPIGGPVTKERRVPATAIVYTAIAVVLIAMASAVVYVALTTRHMPTIVAVARFDNETGDASLDRFADALTDTVTVQLAQAGDGRFGVIGNAAVLRVPRERRDLNAIASSLHAGFIILGQIQRDPPDRAGVTEREALAERPVRVLAHLIRMPDQTHVRVSRTDDLQDPTLARADAIAERITAAFGATLENTKPNTLENANPGNSRAAATR